MTLIIIVHIKRLLLVILLVVILGERVELELVLVGLDGHESDEVSERRSLQETLGQVLGVLIGEGDAGVGNDDNLVTGLLNLDLVSGLAQDTIDLDVLDEVLNVSLNVKDTVLNGSGTVDDNLLGGRGLGGLFLLAYCSKTAKHPGIGSTNGETRICEPYHREL